MRSETMNILVNHLQECLAASNHLVIRDEEYLIYCIMIKSIDLGTNFIIVKSNFLLVRTVNDYYIVRNKVSYILDEYSKFGSVHLEEIEREIEDTDLELAFKQEYKKVKMY